MRKRKHQAAPGLDTHELSAHAKAERLHGRSLTPRQGVRSAPLRPLASGRFKRFRRRLAAMGYETYRDFLASPQWKETRRRFLELHPSCFVCGSPVGVQPHHRTYKRVGQERTRDYYRSDLVTLCRTCHGLTHRVARFRVARGGIDRERLYGAHTDVRLHWPHRNAPCGSALCRHLFLR